MFLNKIQAIKVLRENLHDSVATIVPDSFGGSTFKVEVTNPHAGLKDAKDFIEAVMALGVEEFKRTEEFKRLQRTKKVEDPIEQVRTLFIHYYDGKVGLDEATERLSDIGFKIKL